MTNKNYNERIVLLQVSNHCVHIYKRSFLFLHMHAVCMGCIPILTFSCETEFIALMNNMKKIYKNPCITSKYFNEEFITTCSNCEIITQVYKIILLVRKKIKVSRGRL